VALQRVLAVLVGALDLEVQKLLAVLLALAGDLALKVMTSPGQVIEVKRVPSRRILSRGA